MTRTCAHDPMTAQRQCACDPACVCRIAGNCPAMSGDTIPPRIEDQCQAILPNDRRLEVNDGWKNCSLAQGHTEPHRTAYTGSGTCAGDPAWTLDRAGIEALPSPYYIPPAVQLAPKGLQIANAPFPHEVRDGVLHVFPPLSVNVVDEPIEVVPPERLRAELATWQDEWPGVEQLGEQDTPKP